LWAIKIKNNLKAKHNILSQHIQPNIYPKPDIFHE